MSFVGGTFFGCSVRSASATAGWGGTPSQLTIQLAQDSGQTFTPVNIGAPASFHFYDFTFQGLLQRYHEANGPDGSPLMEVVLTDPKEILEGAQLILGGYGGTVGTVKNLLNVFGYWEATGGYGAAGTNESGMPWYKIRGAIEALTNLPAQGSYGGPLSYRGYTYRVDFSELPQPPIYYRIGGQSIGLLEAISLLCEDAGHDFLITLEGLTIKIRTVSRVQQPPLGTISSLVENAYSGRNSRNSHGLEGRNETTSAFVVGGDVSTLYLSTDLSQFWGYDIAGNPIISTTGYVNFSNPQGQNLLSVPTSFGNLNAQPVADIVGSTSYDCSTLEMRLARANFETWSLFINTARRDIANTSGIGSLFRLLGPTAFQPIRPDAVNDGRDNARNLARMALQQDYHTKAMRLYEFVKSYADEYYGRKYLAFLPLVGRKVDTESGRTFTSYDISQEGGYLPEGSSPLGLSSANEDLLTTPDGRFRPFVKFTSLLGADLNAISPQNSVIEGNTLFLETRTDPNFVWMPDLVTYQWPACLISLPAPVLEPQVDGIAGDATIIAAVLQLNPGLAQPILQNAHIPARIAPAARNPVYAAIPLKSNILVYGPWYVAGAAGKVKFEQDPSLVPWNYGGYTALNVAGNARVVQAITSMQVSEYGQLEVEGSPAASLGDTLDANGPNLTGIDIQIGTQGVTTTYRFHTFTPRFGVFGKNYENRIRKLAVTNQALRRGLREALRERAGVREAIGKATLARHLANLPPAMRRESPHQTLVSQAIWDSGVNEVRLASCWTATHEESLALSNPHDDELFKATSVMSLDGVFRPFCTRPGTGINMPAYATPAVGGLTRTSLDPFQSGSDLQWTSWGETYAGLNIYGRSGEYDYARPMALRGPQVMSGWGFDIAGNPTPSGANSFATNYLRRSDLWKVGPVDQLWDEKRGVWTSHDLYKGLVDTSISAGGSGTVSLYDSNGLTAVKVYAFSDATATGDVTLGYYAWENKLRILGEGTGISTDWKVKVSSSDTTPDYLYNKVTNDGRTNLSVFSPGGNELLIIGVDDAAYNIEGIISTGNQMMGWGPKMFQKVAFSHDGSTTGYAFYNVKPLEISPTNTLRLETDKIIFETDDDENMDGHYRLDGSTDDYTREFRFYGQIFSTTNINTSHNGGFYIQNTGNSQIDRISLLYYPTGIPTVGPGKTIAIGTNLENARLLIGTDSNRVIADYSSTTGGSDVAKFAVRSNSTIYDGLYGTDAIGNVFKGGIVTTVGSSLADGSVGSGQIAAGSVYNNHLANMPAWTFKVRNNASAGIPQDHTLGDFTTDVPSTTGWALGYDAAGEIRKFSFGSLPGPTGVGNSLLADMPAWTFKTRNSSTNGVPLDQALADFTSEPSTTGDWAIGFKDNGEIRKYSLGTLPTSTGVGNSNLAYMPAWTFKVRDNAADGAPQDHGLSDFTTESPSSTGWALGLNAAGEIRKFSLGTIQTIDTIAGALSLTGSITPSTITSSQDDYNPTGLSSATVIRVSADSDWEIRGLAGGADGLIKVLRNVGNNEIYLINESASSTAANRFTFGPAANPHLYLDVGCSVALCYDSTLQRWFGLSYF